MAVHVAEPGGLRLSFVVIHVVILAPHGCLYPHHHVHRMNQHSSMPGKGEVCFTAPWLHDFNSALVRLHS